MAKEAKLFCIPKMLVLPAACRGFHGIYRFTGHQQNKIGVDRSTPILYHILSILSRATVLIENVGFAFIHDVSLPQHSFSFGAVTRQAAKFGQEYRGKKDDATGNFIWFFQPFAKKDRAADQSKNRFK